MKFTTAFTGLVTVFASVASATPVAAEAAELDRRQHSATSASVTGFSVTRNATHINWAATITINPGHSALTFTHSTAGTTLPLNSGTWSDSDPAVGLRVNKIITAPMQYRIILTDAHNTDPSVDLKILSPATEWEGTGTVVYTGPSSFTLL